MLTGKKILVTGGSRGIGAKTVATLHEYGASVVLHYGSNRAAAEELAGSLGPGITPIGGDLADPDTPGQLMRGSLAALGGLDVLVNNAGAWIPSGLEDERAWRTGWNRNLALNLQAAADLSRLAILHFRERGGGAIVNMTSRSAHRGDDAQHLAYGASKAGLLSLTRGIARGYGRDGILAYAVSPGWVATDLAAGAVDETALQNLPLGEITPPTEVAEVVAFLASGRAKHLTGATLDITGADYVR